MSENSDKCVSSLPTAQRDVLKCPALSEQSNVQNLKIVGLLSVKINKSIHLRNSDQRMFGTLLKKISKCGCLLIFCQLTKSCSSDCDHMCTERMEKYCLLVR